MSIPTHTPRPPLLSHMGVPGEMAMDGVDESTWVDVIHKMDEVYSRLIDDEVELEKKNAELEQSQQFIVSVLSSMSDVLVVCDEAGHIEQANAALCELVGQDEAQLRGRRWCDLLADDSSRDTARRSMSRVAGSRQSASVELNLQDHEGQPVPVEVTCSPRMVNRHQRMGTVWVGRPMGELKRAYRELQTAHDALKRTQQQLIHSEKMASLGLLVAGVAHELNNPISFVLGNVHALRKYCDRLQTYMTALQAQVDDPSLGGLSERLRIRHVLSDLPSLLEGTLEGAQRTADIVQSLKRFSARDNEAHTAVNLVDVTDRAIHWVLKGAPSVAVDWTPPPPVVVQGNAGQLQQVLMNLLQNACDALSTLPTACKRCIWVTVTHDASAVQVQVRDNGPGMAPEHLSRVFDPFFTTKPVGKGTGLGLSISYGIVEQHGGRLQADNHPDGGATFVLELPLLGLAGKQMSRQIMRSN